MACLRDLLGVTDQIGGIAQMKKRWIIPGLIVAALALAASGLADPGHGKGKGKSHHGKFGPYDVVTDDHGSCGNAWAVRSEERRVGKEGRSEWWVYHEKKK